MSVIKIHHLISFVLFIPVFLMSFSCTSKSSNSQNGGDKLNFIYAENISIIKYRHYTLASIKDPWHNGKLLQKYILISHADSSKTKNIPEGIIIYIPLRRSVIFTSAHCRLLSYLHAVGQIRGVCDLKYILLPEIKNAVKNGSIINCGDGMAPMIEKIVSIKADAILLSPFENAGGFGKLETIGIPIIQCADYMEQSALGRAEWMKFYGLLFGRERQADSLFSEIDSTYEHLKAKAIKLHRGRSLLLDRKTGNVWYCPGGKSTIGRIIADAKGSYPFSNDLHSGSLPLSAEQVLNIAANSDVWAFKYDGGIPLSRKALLSEYFGYSELKAFKTGRIYECNSRLRPYFDEVPFRPDYLLREMILLLHPGIKGLGNLRYYDKMK